MNEGEFLKEHPSLTHKKFKEQTEHTVILKDEMIISKSELETQIDKEKVKKAIDDIICPLEVGRSEEVKELLLKELGLNVSPLTKQEIRIARQAGMTEGRICNHCGGEIAIRNPRGYCDHLYYPDYCEVCKSAKHKGLK